MAENTFIATLKAEGQSIITAGESAWAEAKAELVQLETTVLNDLEQAITTVIGDAESGASVETLETAVLNILEGVAASAVKSLSSGVLQALIVFAQSAL